ncbi:phenylacetyl-CoA ligase [Escherichia coli]|uniref:Phenylacetyl-CoA ligase n=1 Tax=Escherichia coli TaxID=562 RepID=A0A2X3JWS2_ECOLX|nr:phenylacetyl-CoA ligase [Escherichia coli]
MYRRKFDAAGVHPDDFRELSDLRKFPCTTKQDLRDNYPFDTFAVPMEQVVRIHASSGTTGKPTVVGYTQNDIDNWANIVARSLRAAGGSPKDKIHVAYGLRPVYWWAGRALWCRTSGRYGDPDVWRADGKTSATDLRFSTQI